MTEINNVFTSFRDRWNGRASTWDTEILKPEHYANFEEGYRKFLNFETMVLEAIRIHRLELILVVVQE